MGRLLAGTTGLPAEELTQVVDVAGQVLGATSVQMLVADYGLTSLQPLGQDGPTGPRQSIGGTLAGRCFATGQVVTGDRGATVWVPLTEGSERLGVLEVVHPRWSEVPIGVVEPVIRILVLTLISKRRYTDVILRGRRSEALSVAAEIQWALLPPLTYSTRQVSVSGVLEPAYSIGGDSFDYALNPGKAEFALIDAVGHGVAAVTISVLALNSLRNARREGRDLSTAYLETGALIRREVGRGAFVTGQLGSLDLDDGRLTWLNAGHPTPLLVRNATFAGQLTCTPSLPMGLGGGVNEVATVSLQAWDRVLFYTDGVVESRSPTGVQFGTAQLADLFVRTSAEGTAPAESVRRLAASVLAYNDGPLRDDATLFMLDYHGA
ncbi:MAG TPA: PP2C family protein-serine/threonine phosphatase [Aquihabitans sp.]|nr:PP2C family protein-serine/threonine phosphatase [Aquihabitans sp.]